MLSYKSVAAASGAVWNSVDFKASSLTLTGGPATVTLLASAHVGQGSIIGAGNTVSDAYNFFVDAAPTSASATITRSWSLGIAGPAQLASGLVLGTGLASPGEDDIVFGAGATAVSQSNTGRLGYMLSL